MSDAIANYLSDLQVGITGPLRMSASMEEINGESFIARDASSVEYCAVNLRPNAEHGAHFETIGTLSGSELDGHGNESFKVIHPAELVSSGQIIGS